MPTKISTIRDSARILLKETTPRFWTNAELTQFIIDGAKDLRKGLGELNLDHFLIVDETNMFISADSNTISGVPSNLQQIRIIEPRDTSSNGTTRGIKFVPRQYNSDEFSSARSDSNIDPSGGGVIFFTVTGSGPSAGTPIIRIAPKPSSEILLRVGYVSSLGDLTENSNNPIPGESDLALTAWCVAYARSKEREDHSPDPSWLAIYAQEKRNLIISEEPRQSQEPIITDAIFSSFWNG